MTPWRLRMFGIEPGTDAAAVVLGASHDVTARLMLLRGPERRRAIRRAALYWRNAEFNREPDSAWRVGFADSPLAAHFATGLGAPPPTAQDLDATSDATLGFA